MNAPDYAEYLGDAVYASFDGYAVQLHLNDHRSPAVIVLEPEVLTALTRYVEQLKAKLAEKS